MPVPTRRKRAARQASSDIEEDQSTQPTQGDDVDDASQPVKKEKKPNVKKEKGKAAQKPAPKEDSADEDDAIDIENFPDQPLDKSDCTKMQGFAKDWSGVEEIMHQPAGYINRVAASMAEVAGEEAEEGLAELDRVMRSLLDVQAVMTGHSKVLSDLIQNVATGTDVTNAKEQYLLLVDGMNADYDSKTTRQKYAKSDQYFAFKQAIHEVDHQGAMPPITDFIPREDGDESDDDDDVVMGGVTQEYKCPLLMTLLKDPLTSTVCKHSFSGDALRDFFKNTRGAIKCPATGCNKSFTLAQCKPDPELARKVKDFERRQARTQEDSDAEEIID